MNLTGNVEKNQNSELILIRDSGKHGNAIKKQSNKLKKTYSQLTPKKRLMVDETVDAVINYRTRVDQALSLNITLAALYNRLAKYPQISERLKALENDFLNYAKRKIRVSAPIAADKIVELASNAESENIQLQAASQVLDRAGIVKPQPEQKTQINVFNGIKKDKDTYTF